jgi:8-oxo-dGTP pyrophosphatase MutT (NUDIX family)
LSRLALFLRTKEGTEIFQRRSVDDKIAPNKLSAFGGGRENNENAVECIQRELKEELNLNSSEYNLCYWGLWKTKKQNSEWGTSCLFTAI